MIRMGIQDTLKIYVDIYSLTTKLNGQIKWIIVETRARALDWPHGKERIHLNMSSHPIKADQIYEER